MLLIIIGSVTATLGDDSIYAASGDESDETFSGRSVAEVRDGHLLIKWEGSAGYCWKLLLRYLNLTPSEHATFGFNLVRPGCKSPIVTVTVSTITGYRSTCRLTVLLCTELLIIINYQY